MKGRPKKSDSKVAAMKKKKKRGLPPGSEYVVIAALLALYAVVIFLSPDPEWVVWAGQMSVGVIDPAALPPSSPIEIGEALRTASALSMLGLLAVVVLLAAAIGLRPGRESRPAGHAVAGSDPRGHGTGPHA